MTPFFHLPEIAAESAPAADCDQRTCPDRRREPTGPWSALPPAGRRQRNRRADEHRQPYFVDRFSASLLLLILLLVAASLTDALLTWHLLDQGFQEINPVMKPLISRGIEPFLSVKILMTVVGLPLLLIFKNFYLFGTQVRVGHLIPAVVALYALLIGYQMVLIRQCVYP